MITMLPIKKPALAGEPGFSLLARNAFVNGSLTTAEFCSSTSISKAAICAGKKPELVRLAELTGSTADILVNDSPHVVDRKFIYLNGCRLLSRSVRKANLSICPHCWLNDQESAPSDVYIRRDWLPKLIHTCATHETALIELPYRDYATCYDHVLRSQTDPNWLSRVSDLVTHQVLSKFEKSALDQFSSVRNPCPWLGNQQIDVFERWSLGLGLLVERGRDRPAALPKAEQRHLIDVGYGITRRGQNRLYSEIDTALTRHRTRLSGTWLHQWALQSCAPPERQKFRNLMKQICENQGRFHLLNVSLATADEHLVRCEIASLSDQTNRSKTWVRRALQREMLLPASGVPQTRCLKEHMRRCRRYILAVVESLDSTKSAERLNIGIAGFESLVTDGVISRMKNRSHKKRRFVPSKLDDLLDRIEKNTTTRKAVSNADYCSIPEACFQYGPTTAQVTRLLIGNQLPSSVLLEEKRGFDGVRIRRDELLAAMKRSK